MFRPRLSDRQWAAIAPHLPARPPRPRGGRPPCDDRACLEGVLWVLRTGGRWKDVPAGPHTGLPSGVTCWRRLRDWQAAGSFAAMWAAFLAELTARGRLKWAELAVDGTYVPAKKGARRSAGAAAGPAPGRCS